MPPSPPSPGSRPTRRAFLATLAVGGAGLSAAAYARYAEPAWLEVSETSIDRAIFPAPRGLRILHLSDLHFGPHVSMELIERAVELGLAQRPDLIALTGDFVTGRLREAAAYAAVLRRLSAAAPTFACLGNHDAIVAAGLGQRRHEPGLLRRRSCKVGLLARLGGQLRHRLAAEHVVQVHGPGLVQDPVQVHARLAGAGERGAQLHFFDFGKVKHLCEPRVVLLGQRLA